MKKFMIIAAALALPSAANAAAFINGGFETGPAPGSFTTLASGSTAISGWVVGGNGIDYIGSYWVAGEGSRSIDLSAGNAGSISQTFDTVLGQHYTVDFLLAGNPAGLPNTKTVQVAATGAAAQNFTFDKSGHSLASMGWTHVSYGFTATGSSTTLSFTSLDNTAYGPAIDGVTVTAAIPEPASWAMMILGLGLTGAAMRRRSRGTLAIA